MMNFYNLDVMIWAGYRVRSQQGTQFRIWATQRLKEYIVKGSPKGRFSDGPASETAWHLLPRNRLGRLKYEVSKSTKKAARTSSFTA